MKKNVWIFNHYAMPPKYEVRVRNNKMAEIMQEKGYNVTIFGASTMHNTDINLINNKDRYIKKNYDGLKFVHIRAPKYKGNGISRIKNMLLFPFRLWLYTRKFEERPDVIINDLELMGFFVPFIIGKRYKCPVVTEIRDLWPESIIEFGYLNRKSIIAKALYLAEKWIYIFSDAVIFTKEGEVNYIREQKWDKESGGKIDMSKIHYINNGVDIIEFNQNIKRYCIEDQQLDRDDVFKAVYVGSVRHANSVGKLLDAAKIIEEKGFTDIIFIIYGDGDDRKNLEERIVEEGIKNVYIKGHINKKYIPYVLSKSSINILNYMQSGIWKRGNSSNKLFEYMASGKPVLSTIKMNYCILEKYKCGESVDCYTADAIADKIIEFYKMDKITYQEYCKNSTIGANDFDWKLLTDRVIDVMENV